MEEAALLGRNELFNLSLDYPERVDRCWNRCETGLAWHVACEELAAVVHDFLLEGLSLCVVGEL